MTLSRSWDSLLVVGSTPVALFQTYGTTFCWSRHYCFFSCEVDKVLWFVNEICMQYLKCEVYNLKYYLFEIHGDPENKVQKVK